MNYKKKKHLKQEIYLEKVILKSTFYVILQTKFTNIDQWSSLQKQLANLNAKIWSCPGYLLKKKGIFTDPKHNEYLSNTFSGNITIVYSTNKVFRASENTSLKEVVNYLRNVKFILPLYVFYLNRMLEIHIFDMFSDIIEKKVHVEIIKILLKTHKFTSLLQNHSYRLLKNLSQKTIL